MSRLMADAAAFRLEDPSPHHDLVVRKQGYILLLAPLNIGQIHRNNLFFSERAALYFYFVLAAETCHAPGRDDRLVNGHALDIREGLFGHDLARDKDLCYFLGADID